MTKAKNRCKKLIFWSHCIIKLSKIQKQTLNLNLQSNYLFKSLNAIEIYSWCSPKLVKSLFGLVNRKLYLRAVKSKFVGLLRISFSDGLELVLSCESSASGDNGGVEFLLEVSVSSLIEDVRLDVRFFKSSLSVISAICLSLKSLNG